MVRFESICRAHRVGLGRRRPSVARTGRMPPSPWPAAVALALAAVLLVFQGCARAPVPPAGGTPAPGEAFVLRVITDPPGARVKVNGKDSGSTPILSLDLPRNAAHKVTITAGSLVFEETLSATTSPLHVIYLQTVAETKGFACFVVSSARQDADIYVRGDRIGRGPLTLHLGMPEHVYCWLTAHAPGSKPERHALWSFSPNPLYLQEVRLKLAAADGDPGQVPLPESIRAPVLSWAGLPPGGQQGTQGVRQGTIQGIAAGQPREVFGGPGGMIAVIVEHGFCETIFILDTDEPGTPAGRPVASWRTKNLIWYETSWESAPLAPVGWLGDRLLFIAPEPPPDGRDPGLLGLALWEVNARTGNLRRLTWWKHWCHGLILEGAWLTADSKAAVIHTRGWRSSYFRVVDPETGSDRLLAAAIPVYEPGGCDIAQPSPDGWSVAWTQTSFLPGAGAVTVLDLRTGQERAVLRTDDEILGAAFWSPDSSMLAVAHARPGDEHWIAHGEDGSALFPARFVVVDSAGGRVAEVSVADEILSTRLGWSPGSDRVAVMSVTVEPVTIEGMPEITHTAVTRRVYSGPLRGPLAVAWSNDAAEETRTRQGCSAYEFAADGRLVLTINLADGARTLHMVSEGEPPRRTEIEGFFPAYLWDKGARSYVSIARDAGMLAHSYPGWGLYLIRPDAPLIELVPPGRYPHVSQWEGNLMLTSVHDNEWRVFRLDGVAGSNPGPGR